jgi:hypothetical protein
LVAGVSFASLRLYRYAGQPFKLRGDFIGAAISLRVKGGCSQDWNTPRRSRPKNAPSKAGMAAFKGRSTGHTSSHENVETLGPVEKPAKHSSVRHKREAIPDGNVLAPWLVESVRATKALYYTSYSYP